MFQLYGFINKTTGLGYAIQGNILLEPKILTDIKTAFLTTEKPLEKKLIMAISQNRLTLTVIPKQEYRI